MKKVIIFVSLIFLLTSCSKAVSKDSFMEGLVEYNDNLTSYYSDVSLEIIKGEEVINFECEVYYLADDYYKVIMKDQQTNNTQAIVKNSEGVTVLTPLLNRQFKFSNDWPLNSSHAYLFQSLVKDITSDENATVSNSDKDYVVTSLFNSKTNASLKTQKVTFSSDYKPLYCVVLNEAEEVQMKATFNSFTDNYNLKVSDFDTNAITTSLRLEMGEGNIDVDIETVAPTYAPDGVDFESSVVTDDYIIYNYSGEATYTVTCTEVEEDDVLTTYRTYEDLVLLTCGLGAYNDNSVVFYKGNILVTIYSDSLEIDTLVTIANSF